jgi:hypothetical protein
MVWQIQYGASVGALDGIEEDPEGIGVAIDSEGVSLGAADGSDDPEGSWVPAEGVSLGTLEGRADPDGTGVTGDGVGIGVGIGVTGDGVGITIGADVTGAGVATAPSRHSQIPVRAGKNAHSLKGISPL